MSIRVKGHGSQHAFGGRPDAEVLHRLPADLRRDGEEKGPLVVLLEGVVGALLVHDLNAAGPRVAAAHDEDGVCGRRGRAVGCAHTCV